MVFNNSFVLYTGPAIFRAVFGLQWHILQGTLTNWRLVVRIMKHLVQKLANYSLWVKSSQPSVFLVKFYCKVATPIHLHILYGYFHARTAEWSSCGRDGWLAQPKVFTVWSFMEKVCWPLICWPHLMLHAWRKWTLSLNTRQWKCCVIVNKNRVYYLLNVYMCLALVGMLSYLIVWIISLTSSCIPHCQVYKSSKYELWVETEPNEQC